ncbi:hypothetical protein ACFQDN_24290 [Pseudomonas asuensis]
MFRNMRVTTKLALGFGTVVALLVVVILVGIVNMTAMKVIRHDVFGSFSKDRDG